jgi:hypothetical protein
MIKFIHNTSQLLFVNSNSEFMCWYNGPKKCSWLKTEKCLPVYVFFCTEYNKLMHNIGEFD